MNLQATNLLFMAGIAVYVCIRNYFQLGLRTRKTSINRSSSKDKLLVFLVVVGQIVVPAEYVFSWRLNRWNYELPLPANVMGLVFLLSGLWLFWKSHADLGSSWSVTLKIREDHALVTRGVYSRIRHPMYVSFFILALAQILLVENVLAGWSGMVSVLLLYVGRVRHEEEMLLRSFGPEYQQYRERTGGVLPRIRRARATSVASSERDDISQD